MTRETKAGLVVSCSFLCLVGVVLFSKFNDKESGGTEGLSASELAELTKEPRPVSDDNSTTGAETPSSAGAAHENKNQKLTNDGGIVPARLPVGEEFGSPNPVPSAARKQKESAPEEREKKPQVPVPAPVREPIAPLPKTAVAESSLITQPAPTSNSTPASGAGPGLEGGTASLGLSKSPASVHDPAGPSLTASTGEKTPTPSASGTQPPAPAPLWPDAPKTGKTADNPTKDSSASAAVTKAANASNSANGDAKPKVPFSWPVSTAGVPALSGGAGTTKTGAGSTAAIPPVNAPGSSTTETPKPAGTGAPSPWTIPGRTVGADKETPKNTNAPSNTPKRDASSLVQLPSDSTKPAFQLPEPPPPAPGVVPNPKLPSGWLNKVPQEAAPAESASPRNQPAAVGKDSKPTGAGEDSKAPGLVAGNAGKDMTGTPPTAPATTNLPPFRFPDPPSRTNVNNAAPPNAALAGSTQNLGGSLSNSGASAAIGSSSPGVDKPGLSQTVPARPGKSQAPVDGGTDKVVQLGSPASTSPPQPSATFQTSATSASNGQATLRPLPGAPPAGMPASAPVAFAAPQPPISGAPQVESYDEETYTAKANDSFRAISQQFYHSDQYKRALLLFNRNHPLATGNLQQDSPVLQAGQPIYIPPARILEKYYGAPVSNAVPSVPSSRPSRTVNRPDPAGPIRQASASVVTRVPPASSSSSVPLYRVRAGGEMFLEIARRTLGNDNRWTEIYELNRGYDPKDVIPAGSLLRLPKDAHVDPRDTP
jgi:hypothetical protein